MKLVFNVPLGIDVGLGSRKEIAPVIATGLITAGASLGSNLLNQSNISTNNRLGRDYARWAVHQQEAENERARLWQSGESALARQWEEDMYNQYNSPSAMMRQYREAGLNPYLGASGQTGQGMSSAAPMSSSGANSISPPVFPNQYAPIDLGNDFAQALGVSSQVANQQSQTLKNKLEAIRYAYDNFGSDTAQKLIEKLGIDSSDNLGLSNTQSIITADLMERTQRTYKLQVESSLIENYEKPKAVAMIKQLNKSIDEIQAKIDVLKTEGNLNAGRLRALGSEMARNMAQAGLFQAESGQINSLLKFVRASAGISLSSGLMNLYDQWADFDENSLVRDLKHSDKGKFNRKLVYGLEGKNNPVGAFMQGFVNNIPAGVWNNIRLASPSSGFGRGSGSSATFNNYYSPYLYP